MSDADLEKIMIRGEQPDPDQMADWLYRGTNTPSWAKLLGIKKFVKGFYRGAPQIFNRHGDGPLHGYNISVKQNALTHPWIFKGGQAKRFGFYRVREVNPEETDNAFLQALLLDYGQGKNPIYDPSSGLRDYLVRAYPGRDDILLGQAHYALGPARVKTNYFVLEKYQPA